MPNSQPQAVYRQGLGGMDAWTRHQHFIENYVKFYNNNPMPKENHGITERDILHENHRFLRSDADDQDLTWEKRIAKKYYDKLFKEYALVELKYYKEGRIAMRWRNQKEVMRGKGQFTCGNLRCDEAKGLESWEVNFGYVEQGEKKNALVKVRLCEKCSYKLNYKSAHKRVNTSQVNKYISSSSTETTTAPPKQRSRSLSRDREVRTDASESSQHHNHPYEPSLRSKRKDRSRSRERDVDTDATKFSRQHHRDDRESSKGRKSSSHRDRDEGKTDGRDRLKGSKKSRSPSSSSSPSHREHKRSHSTGAGHDKKDRIEGRYDRSKSDGGRERSSRSDVEAQRGLNHERAKEATDADRTNDREMAIEKSADKGDASGNRLSVGEFERFFKGLFE